MMICSGSVTRRWHARTHTERGRDGERETERERVGLGPSPSALARARIARRRGRKRERDREDKRRATLKCWCVEDSFLCRWWLVVLMGWVGQESCLDNLLELARCVFLYSRQIAFLHVEFIRSPLTGMPSSNLI